MFHYWTTGFVTIVLKIACFRGLFFQSDCNLPSACASGSGSLAAIQTVSSSSSSLDEVRVRSQCRSLHVCSVFQIDVAFLQHLSCANSISSVHAEPGSQPACANCLLHESLPLGPRFTSDCRVSRALMRLAPHHAQCWLQTRKSAQHPCLASGSDCFYPLGTLHPISNYKLPSFARPSAFFDYGNRLAHSFHRLQPALVRLELSTASRVGTDLATCSSPTWLRAPTGCFKLNLLAKTSF